MLIDGAFGNTLWVTQWACTGSDNLVTEVSLKSMPELIAKVFEAMMLASAMMDDVRIIGADRNNTTVLGSMMTRIEISCHATPSDRIRPAETHTKAAENNKTFEAQTMQHNITSREHNQANTKSSFNGQTTIILHSIITAHRVETRMENKIHPLG
jgi:hypothetical protein